jgi:type II secretory pathway component PulF
VPASRCTSRCCPSKTTWAVNIWCWCALAKTSGSLHVVLKELTVQLEADDKLRNYIISSMTYPVILLVVAVLSVIMLLAFVVPQFREIFDSMGDALALRHAAGGAIQ